MPSAEAVQLFDEFITGLAKAEIPVHMISGNHDSAERLSFGQSCLKAVIFIFRRFMMER